MMRTLCLAMVSVMALAAAPGDAAAKAPDFSKLAKEVLGRADKICNQVSALKNMAQKVDASARTAWAKADKKCVAFWNEVSFAVKDHGTLSPQKKKPAPGSSDEEKPGKDKKPGKKKKSGKSNQF